MPVSQGRTPGYRKSKLYRTWLNMRNRCNNVRGQDYEKYNGRGITCCDRWGSFECFEDDVGEPPTPQHTLERVDNDKPYEPDNVIWATRKQQSRNRGAYNVLNMQKARAIRKLYKRKTLTQKLIGDIYGCSQLVVSLVVRNKIWRE